MGLFSFFKKKTAEAPPKELGDVLASNIMDFSLSKSIQYIEDYIAIDFETTGLDYMSDKIIEIGAVHYNKDSIIDSFHTYVNPKISIPLKITSLTGITKHTVKNAPLEQEAAQMLYNYLKPLVSKGAILVAHNAVFDISFLSALFIPNGISLSFDFCDTLALSRILCKNESDNFKLGTMAKLFSIEHEKEHGALEDAKVCGNLFYKLIKKQIDNNLSCWNNLSNLEQEILRKIHSYSPELFEEISVTYSRDKGVLTVYSVNPFITIKFLKTKSYVLIPASYKDELPYELETLKNGDFKFNFNTPDELDKISHIITKRMKAQDYILDRTLNSCSEKQVEYEKYRMRERLLTGNQIILD